MLDAERHDLLAVGSHAGYNSYNLSAAAHANELGMSYVHASSAYAASMPNAAAALGRLHAGSQQQQQSWEGAMHGSMPGAMQNGMHNGMQNGMQGAMHGAMQNSMHGDMQNDIQGYAGHSNGGPTLERTQSGGMQMIAVPAGMSPPTGAIPVGMLQHPPTAPALQGAGIPNSGMGGGVPQGMQGQPGQQHAQGVAYIAVPVGVGATLPDGAVPLGMVDNPPSGFVPGGHVPAAAPVMPATAPVPQPPAEQQQKQQQEPQQQPQSQQPQKAAEATRRMRIVNPKTGEEVLAPGERRRFKIRNPKTGEEVDGTEKDSGTRSKGFRIVDPKTGEDVDINQAKNKSLRIVNPVTGEQVLPSWTETRLEK